MKSSTSTLVISGKHYHQLIHHLFPGDGKEAAAILLCSRIQNPRLRMMVRNVHYVPHDECDRKRDYLTWPGQHIEDCLTEAENDDLSLILVHSHPGGLRQFSSTDDASDLEIMKSLFLDRSAGRQGEMFHGSAIMTPDGWMAARVYNYKSQRIDLDLVNIVGDELLYFYKHEELNRPVLPFSSGMRDRLQEMHVGVVGISGTGSVVSEQLLRLGVGKLTVVDHDVVEPKNLNRILNSTHEDAAQDEAKVKVFQRHARKVFPESLVCAICHEVGTQEAIRALTGVDVVFSCVDTLHGRNICQRLSTSLLIPLFDVGVVIPVRENSSGDIVIQEIQGRIDYIQPGGSSLDTRGVYTPEDLSAEFLRESDPEGFERQAEEGYMPGLDEEAPSVITVNMRAASMVVQEFLARTFPYRLDGNRQCARTLFSLATEETDYFTEDEFEPSNSPQFAAALKSPLLGLPALGRAKWDC
ncbi:ThiF family adenylyltransferase [Marinobacter sp. JSM 1782161]|uniref:ThiF family adenylyltransferase n=1 Tax=Marinobacter sp. JSM 1782161 TaxID=2685906 RepID=UPI00140244A7|nr:ThiF family adenylyltransferase [Marinobacter sp. JSM 1782161]